MPLEHETVTDLFTDIADAIRAKTGGNTPIVADSFPDAIGEIPTTGLGLVTQDENGYIVLDDRAASSGTVFTITNTLTNMTNQNSTTVVGSNQPYSAHLSTNAMCVFDSIMITMGGSAITSNVFDSTTMDINIPSVTGDVIITAWATEYLLPDGYQAVEYIAGTGTPYINTGFKLSSDGEIKVETKTYATGTGTYGTYPVVVMAASNNIYFSVQLASNGQYYSVRAGSSSGNAIASGPSGTSLLNKIVITEGTLSAGNASETTIDATFTYDNTPHDVTATGTSRANNGANLFLFGNGGAHTGSVFKGRIYYVKVWDNDELVLDAIPCYRTSDDVIGMYNRAKETFMTAATGTFTKGDDVTPELTSEQELRQALSIMLGETI